MITRAQIDRSQFDAAMREYVKHSSRETVVVLNGKAKDLMFRTARATAKATYNRDYIEKYYRTHRGLIGYLCNKRYGVGAWNEFHWEDMLRERMGKAMSSRGYMRSSFVKAGRMIHATAATTEKTAPKISNKHSLAKASITIATEKRLKNEGLLTWSSRDSQDEAEKQAIVDKPLKSTKNRILDEMIKHLSNKMAKKGKSLSGK